LFSQVEVEKFIFRNIEFKAWLEHGKLERQEKWGHLPGGNGKQKYDTNSIKKQGKKNRGRNTYLPIFS